MASSSPSVSKPQPDTLPEPHATTLNLLHQAIQAGDLSTLKTAARAMDWELLHHHNAAAMRDRPNDASAPGSDQLLARLASCFNPSSSPSLRNPGPKSQAQIHLEAFAEQALECLVASGYRVLDTPELDTALRTQKNDAILTRVLAPLCFRYGCLDARGATVLHRAFQLRGSGVEHLTAALVPAIAAGQVNAQDNAGNTAWHRWCTLPGLQLLDTQHAGLCAKNLENLLAAGLDPDIRNHAGKTGEECLDERMAAGTLLNPAVMARWKALLSAHRARALDQALPSPSLPAARPAPRL